MSFLKGHLLLEAVEFYDKATQTEEESMPITDKGDRCASHQKAKKYTFPGMTFAFYIPGMSKLEDKHLCKTKLEENKLQLKFHLPVPLSLP